MDGGREFRELLAADAALMLGIAEARDVAAALQRYWDRREQPGVTFEQELAHIARLSPDALTQIRAEVARLLGQADGDAKAALTRHGGLDRSIHVALGAGGANLTRVLSVMGVPIRAPLRMLPAERYVGFEAAGVGGMGIVYAALDTEMSRRVAFKMVRPHAEQGKDEATPSHPLDATRPPKDTPASEVFEQLKARLVQEAWVTGGLEHPGIVPVYEIGQTPSGIPYYTMRYVRGERTLADAIREEKGRPIEERLALLEPFLKVCDTLRYAHAKGVVHRDLKPANVALGQYGEVVLLDWGMARLEGKEDVASSAWQQQVETMRKEADFHTMEGGALGTAGYMAPEAALGDLAEVDQRSDVYSLGAMLFEILTGRLPFEFRSLLEYASVLVRRDPSTAREVDPSVPEALSALCARALAREKAQRPASAQELADAVRAWQVQNLEEREVEALLRDTRSALESAEGLQGDARLAQVDRAAAALVQVELKRAGNAHAKGFALRVQGLRELGIKERERASGRRLMVRVGLAVLALATATGLLVAERLEERRGETQRAYEDVLRLSDSKMIRDLEDRAGRFSPVQPDLETATAAWLKTVGALVRRLPDHIRALQELRSQASAPSPPWRFGDEALAWQHELLTDLVDRLQALEGGTASALTHVHRMHDLAVKVRTSLDGSTDLWRETIDALARDPKYGGLRIVPQRGLVPIGRDPDSGLIEFAHLGSGTVPARHETTGRLVLMRDFALVFVLLPGGTFWMGAQNDDPTQEGFDPDAYAPLESPVRSVTLTPFLLSKYECTRSQWAALAGRPATSVPSGLRLPVTEISWDDARTVLPEFGLDLPSEAQWEYACRAGTTTPWWTGSDRHALDRAAWYRTSDHGRPRPVGMKAANGFGLHDIHGNVLEWCLDTFQHGMNMPPRPPMPLNVTDPVGLIGEGVRPFRGGAFSQSDVHLRASCRSFGAPSYRNLYTGARPARPLLP